MSGPARIAAALSRPNVLERATGRWWQYHSRSDHHSKIACVFVLADLIERCPLLARHAREGRVFFGLNHEMRDFRLSRKKDLDFVLCTAAGQPTDTSLLDLAASYGIAADLPPDQVKLAGSLRRAPVGAVLVALEAKACMTAHIKALPRLYDELNSSQQTVHGASQEALAAGFVMINAAPTFITPSNGRTNVHRQPADTARTLAKVRELPRRAKIDEDGYDALGVVVVDCRNDGSPVGVVEGPPAPTKADIDHYERMIDRLAALYASRFKEL